MKYKQLILNMTQKEFRFAHLGERQDFNPPITDEMTSISFKESWIVEEKPWYWKDTDTYKMIDVP